MKNTERWNDIIYIMCDVDFSVIIVSEVEPTSTGRVCVWDGLCVCDDLSTFPCCSNSSYCKQWAISERNENPRLHCGHRHNPRGKCARSFIVMIRLGQWQCRDKGQVCGWWTLKICLFLLVLHFCGNWSWESKPWAICHVFTKRLCQEAQTSGGWLLDAL